MATQLCARSGAVLTAWNPEPLPRDFRLGSSLSAADSAVLLTAGQDPSNCGLEFSALRLQDSVEQPYMLTPVVTMPKAGTPYRVLRWQNKHQLEAVGSMYPYGLITTGSDTGVEIYNPKKILDAVENTYKTKQLQGAVPAREDFGLLARLSTAQEQQPAEVCSIHADSVCMFRLAAGCADGSVQLFDLEQHERSMVIECVTSASVTGLQWHPHTQNVLAATTSSGSIHVLNPKSRKPLLSIVDPNKRQNISGLCWLEAGKNLVVAFDDPQKSSVVQLWDLRHPKFPYREENGGHQQGILALELCGSDSRFFTTASREGRCVTWAMTNSTVVPYSEVVVGEAVVGLSVSQTPNLGVAAIQTGSDKTLVHTLDGTLVSDRSARMTPQWLNRSSGVEFGFAGKLAWFGLDHQLSFGHISADKEFVAVADELDPFLESQNFVGLCDVKSGQAVNSGDQYESDVWEFLKCAFLSSDERQNYILQLLGFSPQHTSADIERFLGHKGGAGLVAVPASQASVEPAASPKFHPESDVVPNPQDTDNFFDQLANSNDLPETTTSVESKTVEAAVTQTKGYFVATGSWTSHPLSLMRRAFLTGNPLAAVEVGMRANRWAESFILAASLGNPQIMSAVSAAYLEQAKDPFVTTLVKTVDHEYQEIVRTCSLDQWREAAAVLTTYVYGKPEFEELCRFLAKRLEREGGDQRSALLVYLLAGQFTDAMNVLVQMPSTSNRPGSRAIKLIAIRAAAANASLSPSAIQVVSLFVDRLINNGRVALANAVVTLLEAGSDSGGSFAFLKYKVGEVSGGGAGEQPFEVYNIQPAPQPAVFGQPAEHETKSFERPAFDTSYGSALNPTRPPFFSSGGFNQPPTAGGFNQPPNAGGFNQPPNAGGFNQPPNAGGFNQPPTGGFNQPPTSGFNQPPSSGFNQPPPSGFNQPPSSGFNQPPTSGFNQPPTSGFNQPPTSGFNQPPTSGFNQPPTSGFNQPPTSGFNQPPSGGFNQPPSSGFNQPPAPHSKPGYNLTPAYPPQSAPQPNQFSPPQYPHRPMGTSPMGTGSSTHPAAGVGPLSSGLPTPWPLPTDVQQKRSQEPAVPAGAPCPPGDVQKIQSSLFQLLNIHSRSGEDPKKLEDHRAKFTELSQQLESGQVGKEVQQKLLDLSVAIQKMDWIAASKCQQDLNQMAWSRHTKNWILALKRLSAGPAVRPGAIY